MSPGFKRLIEVAAAVAGLATIIGALATISSCLFGDDQLPRIIRRLYPKPQLNVVATFVDNLAPGEVSENTQLLLNGARVGTFKLGGIIKTSSFSVTLKGQAMDYRLLGHEWLVSGAKLPIVGSGLIEINSGKTYKVVGPIRGLGQSYLEVVQ